MKWVNNISVLGKFSIAPLLSIVLIAVIGGLLLLANDSITRAQTEADHISHASSLLQDTMLHTAGTHADMLRTVSWKQSNVGEEEIREAMTQSLGSLAEAQAALAQVPVLEIGEIDGQVAEIRELLTIYANGVDQTLEAAVADAFLGSMFLTDAHISYNALSDSMRALMQAVADAERRTDAAVDSALALATTAFAISAGVAVVLIIAVSTLLGRAISRSTLALTASMGRLAGGERALEIDGTERRDELGAMARAVVVFRDGLIQADQLATEAERNREARERRASEIEAMTQRFDHEVASLLEAVASAATELQGTAHSLSSTADRAKDRSAACSSASEQASDNVQTVASAAEELAASVQEIGRQVEASTRLANNAVGDAETSNRQVQALAEAASKIGEVVQLITTIAEQTNLLALNATIEAARAGDAGKGFAVVASEVKSLANQTAKATEDIAAQIAGIQEATGTTVTSIQGIGARIVEMSGITNQVATAVDQQNSATQEIARNVQSAAGSSKQVSDNIVAVSEAANETGQAAEDVLSASGELSRQAEQLKAFVQEFLADVRAA